MCGQNGRQVLKKRKTVQDDEDDGAGGGMYLYSKEAEELETRPRVSVAEVWREKEVEEGEGGWVVPVDVTPRPYTVTCSPGTDTENPVRENMLI